MVCVLPWSLFQGGFCYSWLILLLAHFSTGSFFYRLMFLLAHVSAGSCFCPIIFLPDHLSTTCHVKAPLPDHFGAASDGTINFRITMTQLPVLVNNATTGHKLQGQTKESLVISVWSKKKNWNYVALSRVTTRQGLFLLSPLPHDVDFSMSPDLLQMLQTLRMRQPENFDYDLLL